MHVVVAIVEGDGIGLDAQEALQRGRLGTRERAEMLGGSLTIESSPGACTTIYVELPFLDAGANP